MNEPAKKPAPAPPPTVDAKFDSPPAKLDPIAGPAPTADPKSDVPAEYNVRMNWITLLPKDMVIGGLSLYGRVNFRPNGASNGNEIWWSESRRHYWVGIYDRNVLITSCRIPESVVGTSQEA